MTYTLQLGRFNPAADHAPCVKTLYAMMREAVEALNSGQHTYSEEDHTHGVAVELARVNDTQYALQLGYVLPEPPVALEQFIYALDAGVTPRRIAWVASVRLERQEGEEGSDGTH